MTSDGQQLALRSFARKAMLPLGLEESLSARLADDLEAGAALAVLVKLPESSSMSDEATHSLLSVLQDLMREFEPTRNDERFELRERRRSSLPPDFSITIDWWVDAQTGHIVGPHRFHASSPIAGRIELSGYSSEDQTDLLRALERLRRQ